MSEKKVKKVQLLDKRAFLFGRLVGLLVLLSTAKTYPGKAVILMENQIQVIFKAIFGPKNRG